MSSAVTSNTNLGNFVVGNTVVSADSIGEALNLNPAILENAVFRSYVASPPCLSFANNSSTATTYTLSASDITVAVDKRLCINYTGTGPVQLNLGTSGPALIALLNLSASHPIVDLNLTLNNLSVLPTTAVLGITLNSVDPSISVTANGVSGTTLFNGTGANLVPANARNRIRVNWISSTGCNATIGVAQGL